MINWGILGTGKIANAFKEAITVCSDAKLVGAASRSLEKANCFVKDLKDVKAYGSYLELVQDKSIDAVYIATPHPYHKENALMCLNHNKAILCEKPFTLNANDAKEVYELAIEKKLFIMEAMWTKFLPTIKRVQEWINLDRIGEIRMIKADFGYKMPFDASHRIFNAALGGGGLLDVGIYPVMFTTLFLGLNPISIQSEAYIGQTGVDLQAAMILKYNEGQLALLSCAVVTDTPKEAILIGTKGKIVIPQFYKANQAYLYVDGRLVEEFNEPFIKNGYEYEINEVNHCLKNHQTYSESYPMETTIKILEIMDTIRKQWNLIYPMEKD